MIAIIDYKSGNISSVTNALKKINADFFVSKNIKEIKKADKIIFPGVGHAGQAIKTLKNLNLINFLQNWKKPFLGICLGMQLMCAKSQEGNTKCLGIIDEKVLSFSKAIKKNKLKIPHMGWNNIVINKKNPLLKGIKNSDYFYFVHSYFAPKNKHTIGEANYGINFSAAIQYNNFYGVQFHPEKSGEIGLKVLTNFVNL